jgi:RIO kinase 1
MKIPPRLVPLLEDGVISRIVRPLLSGKEAQVYLVETDGQLRVAKVYKAAQDRTFRQRAGYTEGRTVRNSRDRRAMERGSRHGRQREEEAWQSAEAETIQRLFAAGVRVPRPHAFIDGVLVMECVQGQDGGPAPRLAECTLEPTHAREIFDQLLRAIVQMLACDLVHGDLSPFNVLLDADGPVVIDFPQAVNAARNHGARDILLRDVANMTSFLRRGEPPHRLRYAWEMWSLYERGELTPDARLTGRFDLPAHEVDTERLLLQMLQIEEDEAATRED